MSSESRPSHQNVIRKSPVASECHQKVLRKCRKVVRKSSENAGKSIESHPKVTPVTLSRPSRRQKVVRKCRKVVRKSRRHAIHTRKSPESRQKALEKSPESRAQPRLMRDRNHEHFKNDWNLVERGKLEGTRHQNHQKVDRKTARKCQNTVTRHAVTPGHPKNERSKSYSFFEKVGI